MPFYIDTSAPFTAVELTGCGGCKTTSQKFDATNAKNLDGTTLSKYTYDNGMEITYQKYMDKFCLKGDKEVCIDDFVFGGISELGGNTSYDSGYESGRFGLGIPQNGDTTDFVKELVKQ